MTLSGLGLIGNCQCAALVDISGEVVWSCLPRFDSEPVFSSLLDAEHGGRFAIRPASGTLGTQRYIENTNILETRFDTPEGSFRVLDFYPRFFLFERSFRPTKLLRIVEPISGTPRIVVECEPRLGWSKERPKQEQGSHHITYLGFESELRLTTDVPLSYLNAHPFALTERRHFVLSWGAPVEEALAPLCDRFLRETTSYWRRWVKHCEVPPMFSEQVIRSALVLKLHCFEDTGAIVAALTTSLPESPGSGRTWDYRYCWLRDSYYVLGALRLLGHFEEREQFLNYLLNIVSASPELNLAPLYRIDGRSNLEESILSHWPGYLGHGPVRIGNQAALHQQHDVFGEMVLALAPLFLDARFREQQSPAVLDLVIQLARKAASVAGQPDAGIWEFRADWRPQTFSSLMCWAAVDRTALITEKHRPEVSGEFRKEAERIRSEILMQGIDPARGSLVGSYGGVEVDASLLQAIPLRFLSMDDPRVFATISAIRKDLEHDGWLHRYRTDDGFGTPRVAFVICQFWLIEALARIGRTDEARTLISQLSGVRSPLGLLAEDVDPGLGEMWGNFPQAYSHVGMIHAAFAASPRWSEVL
jgi:GH15 family glucan-1,4-alpha-glucosidase